MFCWIHHKWKIVADSSWRQRRQWHPTPVLLPGKSHGWRSLVGCSPWGREESDATEQLRFHALEKEMATHSSVLAWRIPGTAEPGGLLSVGLHRVRHDWSDLAAAASLLAPQVALVVENLPGQETQEIHGLIPGLGRYSGGGHDNPLQYSCLRNFMDRGAWWTTIHGAAKRHDWTYTASISMIL